MNYPEYMRDRAFHLYEKGYGTTWIGARLGVSASSVRRWINERGVFDSRRSRYNYEYVRELYDDGLNDHEISRATGIHATTISLWRRRNGLPTNYTCNEVSEDKLFELYNAGLRVCEMARELGTNTSTIAYYCKKYNLRPHNPHKAIKNAMEHDHVATHDEGKPWDDPESLFCDGEFLRTIIRKEPRRMGSNECEEGLA